MIAFRVPPLSNEGKRISSVGEREKKKGEKRGSTIMKLELIAPDYQLTLADNRGATARWFRSFRNFQSLVLYSSSALDGSPSTFLESSVPLRGG